MPFCKYSTTLVNSQFVSIDARFLNDYLPFAPENCLKVYFFGLLKCQNSAGYDNNIENFENVLGLTKKQIIDCFKYWEEQNLVQILDVDPVEIRYLPVKDSAKPLKKYEGKKYQPFVEELYSILCGRDVGPNEVYKYIDFVESNQMQPSDFNMIVKYCADRKGNNINANYILTVAKVWADEGAKTAEKIEEKIESLTLLTSDVNDVAKALKFKGNLSIEHQQLYSKWTKDFGFEKSTILALAKRVSAKTKNFSFEMLDKVLLRYYELKLMSFEEIERYEENKTQLNSLAKQLNKCLGIYYDSMENEIETYVLPWLNRGFEENALVQIANFCFKNSIKTLEGMDVFVQKFAKLGLVSVESIEDYLSEVLSVDEQIKTILDELGLTRRVNNFDRSFFRTWTYTYKFEKDVIFFACSLAKNKPNAMSYANSILTNWFAKNLKTLDEVKTSQTAPSSASTFKGKSFGARAYTSEQVNALFDNLSEIEV